MHHIKVGQRWAGACIVAATGPSLTPEVAAQCVASCLPVVAVNDAWRLLPGAEVLYACDAAWWKHHGGCKEFAGEKWSSFGPANDKRSLVERFPEINLIRGDHGEGFAQNRGRINYGLNSGFQAVNLGLHFIGWRGRVLLVGFDMRATGGKRHFFGDHPEPLHREKPPDQLERYFASFIRAFERAAHLLPEGVEVVNCTPGSALRCFPMMDIADALPLAA